MRVFVVMIALAVSLPVWAQTLNPMMDGVVPVAVREPGDAGSTWSTTVFIRQTAGSNPAVVTMTLHSANGATWSQEVELDGTMGSVIVDDVVSAR